MIPVRVVVDGEGIGPSEVLLGEFHNGISERRRPVEGHPSDVGLETPLGEEEIPLQSAPLTLYQPCQDARQWPSVGRFCLG